MDEEKRLTSAGGERSRRGHGVSRAAALFDDRLIILRGESEMTVHGCKKILQYSTERICLLMRGRQLCICGNGLFCTSFSGGVITLEGRIDSVCYEAEEKG